MLLAQAHFDSISIMGKLFFIKRYIQYNKIANVFISQFLHNLKPEYFLESVDLNY